MKKPAPSGTPGRRTSRGDGGFSLIEVIFATAFLGFGLLAMAQMIPMATHQVVASKRITDAAAAGQAKMEELRGEDWTSAALVAGTYTDVLGSYSRTWTIQDNVPVTGSKRIDLRVTWTTGTGSRQTRLTTFVTR